MQSETLGEQYEQALTLAESGRYELALERMLEYLKVSPGDGKTLNDAGTILFCMQRGAEAVAYFEKALTVCRDDELAQVYWNLCEAYVQEGQPARAAELFGRMRQHGLLNADILNRTAEVFLQKNDLGGAVETLLMSLSLYPDQDVLHPMLEVVRSHRTRTVIFADSETAALHAVQNAIERRLPVETLIGAQVQTIAEKMRQAHAVIFAGAGNSLIHGSSLPKAGKVIILLDESDIYHPAIAQVRWGAADAVFACASAEAIADLRDRTGVRAVTQTHFVMEPGPSPVQEKKAGKRLAAIGPWSLRQNPMFLLQCFQKLHYLDADMRLHLSGGFEDAGLERYVRSAAETMNLDTVVFFDGPVKNLNKWLRDKHFIVSAAIDASGLAGVWTGMANGLKPVVHRFAGIESLFGGAHVFTLAEDFCKLVQSRPFEPAAYRAAAEEQFDKNSAAHRVHAMVCRLEQSAVQTAQENQFVGTSPPLSASPLHEPARCQASAPIDTLAEQALMAARALKNITQQPVESTAAALPHPPQIAFGGPFSQNNASGTHHRQSFSVEPFVEAECPVVPFAGRT